MAKRTFTAGATSQTIDVFVQDTTKTDGSGLSGLVFNSSGLKAYYRKGATGTLTAITLATQTVGGAWSSGGFVEIDATNAKGLYRFDVPDTVFASTPYAVISIYGATNMAQNISELEIVVGNAYDLLTAVQAEPGQGAPAVNASPITKLAYLFKSWRNKVTQTSTTYSLFADDTTTVDQKATVSDDGVTFTRGEIASGP